MKTISNKFEFRSDLQMQDNWGIVEMKLMMLRVRFGGARLWLLVATPWYLAIDTKLQLG